MDLQVLPVIDELLPVTRINLRTVNGSIVISPKDSEPPNDNTFLPIPDTLANVSRVLISQLRKCEMEISHLYVDLVNIAGGSDDSWYAFKRYRIPFDEEDRPTSILLSEVEYLNGLQSPYIIRPAFLVTDDSNSVFRGYLTPFMPAGTLADVFDNLASKDGFADSVDDESEDPGPRVLLHPKVPHPSSPEAQVGREDAEGKAFVRKLSWPLKHTWSVDATNGVVALHDHGTCSGDIKLDNIVLCRDGHLQLIDVAPMISEGYTEHYMPPEFGPVFEQVGGRLPMTEARDVFALGIVLWQIAEEVASFDREDPLASPCLVWAEGQDSTPQWYRDLIDSCLETDADKRPTARHILEALTAGP